MKSVGSWGSFGRSVGVVGTWGIFGGSIVAKKTPRHYPSVVQLGQYDQLFPRLASCDSNKHLQLLVMSEHLDIVDDASILMSPEIYPDKATPDGLLNWWEDLAGTAPENTSSVVARQQTVKAVFRARGGLSKPYFRRIAESYGYNYGQSAPIPRIWFEEGRFAPFRADISSAGDLVWDQDAVYNSKTVVIYGTRVEQNSKMIALMNKRKCLSVTFIFRSV